MRKFEIIILGLILSAALAIIGAYEQEAKGALKTEHLGGQAVSEEKQASQLADNKEDNSEEERKDVVDKPSDENNLEEEVPEEIDKDSEYLLLVNKENRLTEEYVPESLVLPNITFIDYVDDIVRVVEKETAQALEDMFRAAEQDGIILYGMSGYRSYNIQSALYSKNVKSKGKAHAARYSAEAGASEHQTGLAMDVVSSDYKTLRTGFENTEAFKWLQDNCYKYGFILRYPNGKEEITGYAYEPWHYRYVGLPHSETITKNNLTLEEYLKSY